MRQLLRLVAVLVSCGIAAAGCDDHTYRSLASWPAMSVDVNVDVGVPIRPYSGDEKLTSLSLTTKYDTSTCLTLDGSTRVMLDGKPADEILPGDLEDLTERGTGELTCVEPEIFFDTLPAPRDTSVITLADDSDEWSIAVDQLLVNPEITLGALHPGQETVATVSDTRVFEIRSLWFQPVFDEPNPTYWYQVPTTIVGNEIHFTVPANAHGSGTVGIELGFKEHHIECVGFASCTVLTRGGASFDVSIQ